MDELARGCNEGRLTPDERAEYEAYVSAATLIVRRRGRVMSRALRRLVRDRADGRCEYCRVRQDADPFFDRGGNLRVGRLGAAVFVSGMTRRRLECWPIPSKGGAS